MFPKVVQVIPYRDYKVDVYFEDGKIVCYDASQLLEKKVFERLKDIDFFLNNALHCGAYSDAVETFLGMYSYFRSYIGPDYGSSIWADVREMSEELPHIEEDKKLGYYQIFGHTQLENDPIVKEDFACLDVRRYFELTDTEILKDPTCGREYDLNNLKKG